MPGSGPESIVRSFNDAWNRHDVDGLMALMTDDVVFENTSPPDGERLEGHTAVREAWESFFASSPEAHFDFEEVFAAGDRCIVLWTYRWGEDGYVRGVDVMRVRDGKICEKFSYVKG